MNMTQQQKTKWRSNAKTVNFYIPYSRYPATAKVSIEEAHYISKQSRENMKNLADLARRIF